MKKKLEVKIENSGNVYFFKDGDDSHVFSAGNMNSKSGVFASCRSGKVVREAARKIFGEDDYELVWRGTEKVLPFNL